MHTKKQGQFTSKTSILRDVVYLYRPKICVAEMFGKNFLFLSAQGVGVVLVEADLLYFVYLF